MLFTLTILSPTTTAFSGDTPCAHWRFQASTAPFGLMPSTESTLSFSWCETSRPKSVSSAFRSVKLNTFGGGTGNEDVRDNAMGVPLDLGGGDWLVCCCSFGDGEPAPGVTGDKASTKESGAAGELVGIDEKGNGGTPGRGETAPASVLSGERKSCVDPVLCDRKGVNPGAPLEGACVNCPLLVVDADNAACVNCVLVPADTEAHSDPTVPSAFPKIVNRDARLLSTCLRPSLSASRARCLSKHRAISADKRSFCSF